jgi:hypothetical protein
MFFVSRATIPATPVPTTEPTATPDSNATQIAALSNQLATMQAAASATPAPTATSAPIATLEPTAVATAVLSGKTCDGKCWEIDQVNKKLISKFPTDGTEDVWLADEFLDLVRQGYTMEFGPMSVPGVLEICNGDVKIDSNIVNYTQGKCTSTLSVTTGSFSISNSLGTSGGARWKPQSGYGWNK